jgi:hypothetical protein
MPKQATPVVLDRAKIAEHLGVLGRLRVIENSDRGR